MIQARHIFWATLGKEINAVQKTAEETLTVLKKKEKSFEQLAAAQSEDPRSKSQGGQLGWLSKDRLPADFTSPLFSLTKNEPALIQTKLGWHIVEVLDRKNATPRSIDECRAEIEQRLSEQKRPEALQNIRLAIRQSHRDHIHIYQAVLDELP